MLTISRNVLRK
jgi:E3 ubiquitin-protein ligase BRE1